MLPDSPHPGFPLLKVLKISISKFNAEDIASLTSTALNGKLPKLENLYVSGNVLGNPLKHLCGDERRPTFPSLRILTAMDLNSTDVVSLGMAIKDENFPKLEMLDLRFNYFKICQAEVEKLIKNCLKKPKQPPLELNLLSTDVEPEFRSKILDTYTSQAAHTHVIIYI